MSLTILIPVKNEEDGILNTLKYFEESWVSNIDHELIFIDDFSTDKTLQKINEFNSLRLNYKTIKNNKKGLGSAIICGIENSSKEFITIFMADLSDDVNDLKKYYDIILDGETDAVMGSRFIKGSNVKEYPRTKYLINRIANNIIKMILFSNYNDFTNAFKLYKRKTLLELYPLVSENFNIFLELPLKIVIRKYNYKIIPISWNGRAFGISKFKIKELGSKYIFTFLYCLLEKILLKK